MFGARLARWITQNHSGFRLSNSTEVYSRFLAKFCCQTQRCKNNLELKTHVWSLRVLLGSLLIWRARSILVWDCQGSVFRCYERWQLFVVVFGSDRGVRNTTSISDTFIPLQNKSGSTSNLLLGSENDHFDGRSVLLLPRGRSRRC